MPQNIRSIRSLLRTMVTALAMPMFFTVAPVTAQETEGPLSPAGRLRIEARPTFHSWSNRFGDTGREPLAIDLIDPTGARLFPGISTLQDRLRDVLDAPGYTALLGSSSAYVSASQTRIPIRLDLGIRDWLSIGLNVPLVQSRTEVAFSFRADTTNANLGVSPAIRAPGEVLAFVGDVQARALAARSRADEICAAQPGTPACASALQVGQTGERILAGFVSAYGASPFFPLGGTPTAAALMDRVGAFNSGLVELGLTPLTSQPLFAQARLTRGDLDLLLTDPAVGLNTAPLADRLGLWQLGDIEIQAVLRLIEGGTDGPVAGGALPGFTYQVGAGVLVRLGTGTRDDPDIFLDLAGGDGQTDLEGRVFANVRSGRFGLWNDLRYGVQRPTTILRRIGPPDLVFVPAANRAVVRWTPGNYLQLELVPRYHVTDAIAFTLGYSLFTKGEDEYERIGTPIQTNGDGPLPTPPSYTDEALLEVGTDRTLHELGGGIVFSSLGAAREGRARLPLEARLGVHWGVAGSGQAPAGIRAVLGLRVFRTFWGN